MRFIVLSTFLLASLAAGQALDGIEIQKQRLIKFPEEFDPNASSAATPAKVDEAQRILDQIAKVNEAFGYVKKKPEQPKLPPILDSSQYLFPKPPQQPFHAQQHHFAGSNGQTLLEPSIRAVKLTRNAFSTAAGQSGASGERLYFRPNQVELPQPESEQEAQQLPAHFVIPVHLYKLNKEQYLREHAPHEYRVKGYKIIGDVDSFYGKAKKQQQKQAKSTPKYHLFFLPRELALNDDGTPKRGPGFTSTTKATSSNIATTKLPTKTRPDSHERPVHKPQTQAQSQPQSQPQSQSHRIPVSTASASEPNNLISGNRKRISSTTKPVRAKEGDQALPNNVQTSSPSIKVTSAPQHSIIATDQLPTLPPSGGLLPNRNRLQAFRVPSVNLAEMQNQTSTAIKNAFQNIFKLPFRTPIAATGATADVTTVPGVMVGAPQSQDSNSSMDDYKWDDEREGGGDGSDFDTVEQLENTAAEQADSSSEKHLFKHKAHKVMATIGAVATAHHGTQKQALREGGIIIQRLKVRKGGIAIAGPGGVATAGSGGTAIVGPGGYALTHPRSLTIAGPGAKVISIPAEVDLKDALQRTDVNAKSFPREGKVVATGPTVYWAPPTGNEQEEEEVEEQEQEQEQDF